MDSSLFDLTPLLRLVLLAVVIALGPLVWLWMRHGAKDAPARGRALTLLILFLTFDLVLFGAFTRLTDSGLGCPDWPGCYGSATPLGARSDIQAAQDAMPTGPVTHGKAWIEMLHRYFAAGLGVLITVAMVSAWVTRRRDPSNSPSPAWATATFVWVCVQGAFGALTVTMKLNPAIVTLHLLGGFAGLALLTAQAMSERRLRLALPDGVRRLAWVVLALLVVQSALGGWVSTNYAVLACREFPMCQGTWWPPMDFARGFTLLRDLGMDGDGQVLPFAALTAIHYTHRLAAYVVLSLMVWLGWRLWSSEQPALRPFAQGVVGLATWQLLSGLSNVVLGWPIVAALAHTGGAAAAIVLLTALLVRGRRSRPDAVARGVPAVV